jgi:formylglycine-generating enzyme
MYTFHGPGPPDAYPLPGSYVEPPAEPVGLLPYMVVQARSRGIALVMSTTSRPRPSLRHSKAACASLLASLAAFGCTDGKSPEPAAHEAPAEPAGPAEPATLVIDLPVGVEVGVDGGERRAVPIAAMEVEAGKHTLALVTACQRLELELEARGGETIRIDRARATGLELATLEVTARDLDGKLLTHSVLVDETLVGGGSDTSTTVVPACKHRMKVAAQGVGGFIEDIDFRQEPRAKRELVLSPGPDMVRIHGGAFTLGPPASSARIEGGWDLLPPPKDVVFSTFDMDKTEVTAAQFHECRASGRCSWSWGRDIGLEKWPHSPPGPEERFCTTVVDYGTRKPVAGREEHPMNCVSYHEAEMYCAAVGKRLPKAAEWEFAGRSRKADYYCPWRPPEDLSRDNFGCEGGRMSELGTHRVCLYPDQSTEQGLCDMPWNVAEIVTDEYVPDPGAIASEVSSRGGWNEYDIEVIMMFFRYRPRSGLRETKYHSMPSDQDVRIGFRCVRDPVSTQPRVLDGSEG